VVLRISVQHFYAVVEHYKSKEKILKKIPKKLIEKDLKHEYFSNRRSWIYW
jgi:signal recognition particle subunit SEC65